MCRLLYIDLIRSPVRVLSIFCSYSCAYSVHCIICLISRLSVKRQV